MLMPLQWRYINQPRHEFADCKRTAVLQVMSCFMYDSLDATDQYTITDQDIA